MATSFVGATSTLGRSIRTTSDYVLRLPQFIHECRRRNSDPGLPLPNRNMQSNEFRNRGGRRVSVESVPESMTSSAETAGEVTPSTEREGSHGEGDVQDDVSEDVPVSPSSWQRILSGFSSTAVDPAFAAVLQARQEEYEKCKSKDLNGFKKGFPGLARVQSANPDVLIYRSYKYIRTRLLTNLELELNGLEHKLAELDEQDSCDEARKHTLYGITHLEDIDSAQRVLLKKISDKLKEYDDLLFNLARISALGPPQKRNHESLFNLVLNEPKIDSAHRDFVYHADDFVSVSGHHPNFIEQMLQNHLASCPSSWLQYLATTKEDVENGNPLERQFSTTRTAALAKAFSVSLAVGSLLVPVYLFFLVSMTREMMALVMTIFLVLFSAVMSVSGAELPQVFIGTATYGAVLIMFLGNLNEGERP